MHHVPRPQPIATQWLVHAPARPAESPVWDADRRVLWWVDIMEAALHAFEPSTGEDRVFALPQPVGAVGLARGRGLVVALATGLAAFDPDDGKIAWIAEVEADQPGTRANDGKPGPDGAWWGGTMALDESPGGGALYRVTPTGAVTTLLTGVSISNGLDWISPGELYYVDSYAGGIDVLVFDGVAGRVTQRRRLIDVSPGEGLPDGLTADRDGNLWVAICGGGEIRQYSPEGVLLRRLAMPQATPTSCAFGGPDLGDLYITVMASDGPGGLLRCRPGAIGRPPFRFAAPA